MTEAVAAIGIAVVCHQRSVLVGTRRADQTLAGHAEFPGGRCAAGESPRDAAVRECLEETGLPVVAVRLLDEQRHTYPHGRVHLHFWLCEPRDAQRLLSDTGFEWTALDQLAQLDFPAANQRVLRLLQQFPRGRHHPNSS